MREEMVQLFKQFRAAGGSKALQDQLQQQFLLLQQLRSLFCRALALEMWISAAPRILLTIFKGILESFGYIYHYLLGYVYDTVNVLK